jgi:cyclophilin family peptidyl-prolyl cis-trans isomerase
MIVEFDDNQHEVIIELAPINLMPHAVHIFLSQISEGYWTRGTSAIVMNPGHVLQACPHPCLETKALGGSYPGDPYVDMRHAGLDSVSFQEYHPEYPHEKYTIGFAGRPHSGPEFYINLMNNTLDHGPKQAKTVEEVVDETALEPDPCFGKIISGFEVIDKISEEGITRADLPDESKEKDGDDDNEEVLSDSLLIQPVMIVSMRIIFESDDDSSSTEDSTRNEL